MKTSAKTKLIIILASIMACMIVFTFTACNTGNQSDNKTEYFNEYNMYLVYAASQNVAPLDYETWLATVKGEKGNDEKSAFQIFKEHYPDYNGTEEEWIAAISKGEICSLFGHSFDDGVVTIQPTKNKGGEKTYTCKICKNTKTEVMPAIEADKIEIYEENGKKYVNFGRYPQTHVGDSALISVLEKLTVRNQRGFYEYDGKEYMKILENPFRYGKETDADGNIVYRRYRDGTIIYWNSQDEEWFMVEPVKWRVLEEFDGYVKVVSTVILDTSCYYTNTFYRKIDGVSIAPNNYKYSTLRGFLNNEFYNIAFTPLQQNAILITDVDNSEDTTYKSPNPYACENTQDKIFALSYSEVKNTAYFADSDERQLKVTDYAIATGVPYIRDTYESVWQLRSPLVVDYSISTIHLGSFRSFIYQIKDPFGVVPAMQICIG